jgi:PAS domain S-box-containing protein
MTTTTPAWKSSLLLMGLIGAGIAGNYFGAPLFFGLDFLFGSIAVLLILSLYGIGWGIAAAVISSIYTYVLWGHPWAIAIFTCEALFVGALLRRRHRNLPLIDALFWLLVGLPLIGLFYGVLMHTGVRATLLIGMKQSVNGIFNALLASLLLDHSLLRRWRGAPGQRSVSLRQRLLNLLVALVLLPALFLMVLGGLEEMRRIEEDLETQLRSTASLIARRLASWKHQHVGAVTALAQAAADAGMAPSEALSLSTAALHEAFPELHNLYVADASGTTLAFHPERNAQGQPTIGLSFADRPYFAELRQSLQPVVSDVFQGRGGVFAPIVAIAVPVVQDARFAGFALGALDLGQLQALLRRYTRAEGLRATLLDRHGRIIASTVEHLKPMQDFSSPPDGELRPIDTTTYQWLPATPGIPAVVRWRESFLAQRLSAGIEPWTLVVEAPMGPSQRRLHDRYLERLVTMFVLSLIAIVLSTVLARWLAEPLHQLARVTTDLPGRLFDPGPIHWPRSSVAEVASLVANFQTMLGTLKQQFQTVQISELRFRTMVEQSPLSIQLFAPDGTSLQANRAWEDLWQSSREQLEGYNILQDPLLRERGALEPIERAFNGEASVIPPVLYDPAAIGKSGRARWVEAYLYPVRDELGRICEVVLMLQDVTERKRIEEERSRLLQSEQEARAAAERLYEEAREAARSKDEFLAMLAHELRNPLSAVSNALYVLRLAPDDATRERAYEVLERQVQHQTRMVDDLLDVSRITRGKVELRRAPLELVGLVRNTAEDHRSSLEAAGLQLDLELPALPLWTSGDSTRLAQVLSNLLHNAQKFSEPGGRILVVVSVNESASTARVAVRDTGAGIAPEMLPRIFEPFTQGDRSLDRSQGGLGLGLALVRGLVHLHGGEVFASSAGARAGAEIGFHLPLEPAARPEPAAADAPAASRQGRLRILLVEDNSDAAQTLRDLLMLAGHEVEIADTGPAGIEAARRRRPDVVLCDIGLPGMDGYQVATALGREPALRPARLIALSGYGRLEDRRRAEAAGFDLHLTKPVDPVQLRRLLEDDL